MTKTPVVVIAIALFACGKKDDDGKRAEPSTKPASDSPPAAMKPAPPPSSDVHMSCDKLVPKALVDKYLAGLELDAKQVQRGEHLSCQWKRKDPMAIVGISFECKERVYESMAMTISMMTDAKENKVPAKKVDGIGKGAISISDGNLNFWATNAHCMVVIAALGDTPVHKDPAALAKDLDAALTPASLQ